MNRLKEIADRLNAATPGPWRQWKEDESRRGSAVETAWAHDEAGEDTDLITDWCSPQDAVFIAHSPEDVGCLLKAVQDVLALVEAAEEDYRVAQEGSPTFLIARPVVDAEELREAITSAIEGTR